MGEFPSGQRGQTVNLLSVTSVVRIHPPPPGRSKLHIACSDFFSKVRACAFRCSSFSAKGHVRVACSLVNALTTALAHYQPFAGTQGSCIFFVVPFHYVVAGCISPAAIFHAAQKLPQGVSLAYNNIPLIVYCQDK